MKLTPEQMAERLRELAAHIRTNAFPRAEIAEGFDLMAEAIEPAEPPAAHPDDTTGTA